VAAAFSGLWIFALFMGNVAPLLLGAESSWMADASYAKAYNIIAAIGLILSLALTGYAARWHRTRQRLLDVGLVYYVATAFLVSLATLWYPQPHPNGISWVAFIIVVYPSIAPSTPAKVLAAALIAATSDPVSLWLASLRGVEIPYSSLELAWLLIPNYLAAFIAVIPVRIIGGLGRQVSKAKELGSYRLGNLLGEGGMGAVYHAEHRLLARPAAIKLIKPELLDPTSGANAVERFRREAEAAAALSSPHTISLYDFGATDDGTFYYVMELLDGVDAEHLVEHHGPQPVARVVHILAQATASLAEAHARGMVHRDVKPSNVFISRLGLEMDFVKILDFGIVALRNGGQGVKAAKLTAADALAGTPNIMAPEVTIGDREPDARVDVYALGCLAYWLLTGERVFEGTTPIQVLLKHANEPPRPPSERSPYPDARILDDLVLQCLAKDPEMRPRDAAHLGQLLREIQLGEAWTQEQAEHWWSQHHPEGLAMGPCDQGHVVPVQRT
jgi:serine/threonine-protein kinase